MGRARAAGLAGDRQWILLGHWRQQASGALESEADGEGFFLSARGKRDPEAELEATIRAVLSPAAFAGKQHPMCRFPARTLYLVGKLGLDPSVLPKRPCPEFEEFAQRLEPHALIFVFSSYYMNNPASAFGHTFFRIEKRREGVAALSGRRELLDYGIDYSATVDTGNAVLYALKGLTGLFKGGFRRMPYYYKVRQYNDAESRDLWEYELDLAPAELAMFIAHLWELGGTWFDYWYLTENCSYHILAALEAARPDLRFIDGMGLPVIPADTVKLVTESPGLVKRVTFRPSVRTVFHERIAGMNDTQLDAVEDLYAHPDAPMPVDLSPAERVQVLDAAADLVDMRYAKELLRGDDGPGDRKKQKLLERRAELAVVSPEVQPEPPWFRMPHTGHDSHRIGLGAGADRDGTGFATFEWRLALHDLVDPPRGYPELSQLEFLPTRIRVFDDGHVRLDDLALVQVLSLAPQDRFDRRLSFRVRFAATRIDDEGCDDCLAASGEIGGGTTFAWLDDRLAIFALGDTTLQWSRDLIGIDVGDETIPWRLGIGPLAGIRARFSDGFVAFVTGTWLYLPTQTPRSTWRTTATMRLALTSWMALDLEGRADPSTTEARLATMFYF